MLAGDHHGGGGGSEMARLEQPAPDLAQEENGRSNDKVQLVGSSPSTTSPATAKGVGDHFRSELRNAWSSDWIKALLIGLVYPFVPFFIVGDLLVQRLLKISGSTSSDNPHTDRGRRLIDWFCDLNLSAVLVRICVLGEVALTFNVLFSKLTVVFLSWLNGALVSLTFSEVCLLVVVVGLVLFLLPPVPGVPVYVFSGIVIATQAQRWQWISFTGAIVLTSFLCLCTKLVASILQYFIGLYMGKSIKIQQMIGVDRVPTRAIEKIVSQRGLRLSKVFVLCGGPDWPVSVTCGILRVNIPQMLLGTLPVTIIQAPCVVAGAFLSRVEGGQDDPWVHRSSLAILVASFGQGGAFLMAVVYIGYTVAAHRVELAQPRPEHQQVEELTMKEKQYDDAYFATTKWNTMHRGLRAVIAVAAYLMILSVFVLSALGRRMFRPFVLTSKISDPWDAYPPGLNRDVFSILLPPAYPVLGVFSLAVVLHVCYIKSIERRATAMVEQQAREVSE